MAENSASPSTAGPANPTTQTAVFPAQWLASIEDFRELEGTGHALLLTSSEDSSIRMNSLLGVRSSFINTNIYENMETAKKHSGEVSLVHRLARFRSELWSRGFQIVHRHATIQQAYRRLAKTHNLALGIPEMMYDLSTRNNACLIWRGNGKLDDLRFYRPEATRIDIVGMTLWVRPSQDLKDAINAATADALEKYIKSHSQSEEYVRKWIDAIKNITADNPQYTGYVPLRESEGEYYQLIRGSGGYSNQEYSDVTMKSIFSDIELLQMLIDGDFATAYLIKNMIVLVKVGESITGGPLQGSRRNWPTATDLSNLKTEFEKTGKAQIIYGNHTITVEFAHPDATVFTPEKYEAVIDRICTFFGVGEYMVMGSETGTGSSYSQNSWNVQAIRSEAKSMRELVTEHFEKFFDHHAVKRAALNGLGDIHWHGAIDSIQGNQLRLLEMEYRDFSAENLGILQHSTDGFATVENIPIIEVAPDISAIVVGKKPPEDAESDHYRLLMTGNQIISLMGPPTIRFNERSLKEDRQALQEIRFAVEQGPLALREAMDELGWDFDTQLVEKLKEKRVQEILMPVFEKSQGLVEMMLLRALNAGMDMVDGQTGEEADPPGQTGDKGEPGRPSTSPDDVRDTNPQPRPSTASMADPVILGIDPARDISSMTEEIAAEMEIAVWKSLRNVPVRLKKLHGVALTLSQINAIAKHAEGAESGGADSGWAVAIQHFLDTHVAKGKRWVKKR